MHSVIDQMQRPVPVPDHAHRIISLVPSQTELLHDLGLGDRVVGITKFCVHPEEWFRSKPRVGGTKKVDLDKVCALKPDLIIGNKEENSRADIEALEQEFPVWMSDVRDLPGALDMITAIGALTGTTNQASALRQAITDGFKDLQPHPKGWRVAYLIWRRPWMGAARDTFIDDMLARCGFANALDDLPGRYPEITEGQLAMADPDLVFLSSEPYPFREKHMGELSLILPGAPIRMVDGEYFSWYGSRLLGAPDHFRQVLQGLPA